MPSLKRGMAFPSGAAPPENFFRDVIYAQPSRAPSRAPWDIQRHQPALESAEGLFTGRVLDVGCGLGDNARWLAARPGVTSVLAVDLAPAAIDEARARGTCGSLAFEVRDVFSPEAIGPAAPFDALLDSAVFHCIGDDAAQRRYLQAITPLIRPGGRAVLLVFSDENPAETWRGPRRIPAAHARALWEEAGWKIDSLETGARYMDAMGRCEGKGGHALLMTATRAAQAGVLGEGSAC